MSFPVKLIECPRDAMQGVHEFIPTEKKIEYINLIIKTGYDAVDFGSFVSPQAVPQMKDTAKVLSKLDLPTGHSPLLAIVANLRGAKDAATFDEIAYLGYPFSVSETFQKRNTNSTIAESLITVEQIQKLCIASGKKLVIYISMGFGNPYGDDWSAEIVYSWVKKMAELGIGTIALSDTVGVAVPSSIEYVFSHLVPSMPEIEFGAHLHSNPNSWKEKIAAAYDNGCRRFDSAIKGYGGCPMAKDELVGNMATENLLSFFDEKKIPLKINRSLFLDAMRYSGEVFLN